MSKLKNLSLKLIINFIKDVWRIKRWIFIWILSIRAYKALNQFFILLVSKELIDRIISVSSGELTISETYIYHFVALEVTLFAIDSLIIRLQEMLEIRMFTLLNEASNIELIEIAGSLPLNVLEDDKFINLMDSVRAENKMRIGILPKIFALFENAIKFITIFIAVMVFDPLLMLFYSIAIIPSFIFEIKNNRIRKDLINSHKTVRKKMDYFLNTSLSESSFREIVTSALFPEFKSRYQKLSNIKRDEEHAFYKNRLYKAYFFELTPIIVYTIFSFYLVNEALISAITVGQFIYFIGMLSKARQGTSSFAINLSAIGSEGVYLQSYYELKNYRYFYEDKQGGNISLNAKNGFQIEFENVSFKYPNSKNWALKNLSLKISSGESVAIVGRNGSGKSTLIKLILGLYTVQEGQVLINDIPVEKIDQKSLHKLMSVFFQDFQKYKLTANDNVIFGDIWNHDSEKVQTALKLSGANEVVEALPNKLDQYVGRKFPGGVDISGGQWQKLCLSRFFMKDRAELYILDEPTSAMDVKSSEIILKNYFSFIKSKTNILITHHLSSAKNASKIFVLEEGILVESGSHQSLMDNDSTYAELYSLMKKTYS